MKKRLMIDGMSCQHCVMHVTEALKEITGVKSVNVNLQGGYAIVELTDDVKDSVFSAAIEDAGYELLKVENA